MRWNSKVGREVCAKLAEEQISPSHLVTERHSQIKKFMGEGHPEITLWFDCWHIAKGKKVNDMHVQ